MSIENGTGVDLSTIQDGTGTDAQDLTLASNVLSLTNDASSVDLSGYLDNTDAQTVSLSGTTLAISNGNTIDLASLQDGTGTDAQNLASATLSGTTLTVAIENGASVNVDLSSLLTDIETRLDAIEACACSGTLATTTVSGEREMGARLYQNTPNPYSIETKLSFFIPIKY